MPIKSYPYRSIVLVNILAIVPLGYIVRFSPSLPESIRDPAGSIAYEMFWILTVIFFYPRANRQLTAIWVCLGSCAIEFLQLYQPPWLQAIRATLPGRLVLGSTFLWSDLPVYFIGSYLGWLWIRWLDRLGFRV
jgi:glycopeptide antibiotics resistance protein